MKKFALLALAASTLSVAHATDLYNDLGDSTVNYGNGDWDGGENDFGFGYGLQTGQLFTSSITGTVTSVEGEFVAYDSPFNYTSALVQIYNFSGGTVGSLVGQQTVTGTATDLGYDSNFGLEDIDVTANVNISGLVAGNQYVAVLQGQGSSWAFLLQNGDGNQDTYMRDYSSFGNAGGFGFTNWTESGSYSGQSGDNEMRIQGTAAPEPCSMIALGLGAAALLRRKLR